MLLLVTFAPIVAAILIMLGLPARTTALAASVLTLLTSVLLFLGFDSIARGFQFVFTIPISTELRLNFALGVDGLSLLMILLGAIVLLAAVWFTGEIEHHENAFYACLLLIAGAAIDVTAEEPLPAESPLWDLPNTFITPHTAGETRRYEDNVLDILEENLQRLWRGEAKLRNQIV